MRERKRGRERIGEKKALVSYEMMLKLRTFTENKGF